MRLAIVADVHGNLAALQAVLADLDRIAPDQVVQGGDLVLNGPRPAECLAAVRERGWPGVRGNTDEALWDTAGRPEPPGLGALADWARERIGDQGLTWLQTLPMEWREGQEVALVHAVPGDLWRAVKADAPESELRETFRPLRARLAVYCHIHVPFIRPAGEGLTVANTGSVGLPLDGDPRASYLLIEDGRPTTRRVGYDIEQAVRDAHACGHPAATNLERIYREATP